MYIIKNAYKSIIRAKGRNILIFILVLLIAVSACVALSVRNSAEAAKKSAYDSLSITAQINTNRQNIMGGEDGFDRETMMGMNVPEDFDVYDTNSSNSSGFGGGMGNMMGRTNSDLTVIGYGSHDAMTLFINGENVICEGNVFNQNITTTTNDNFGEKFQGSMPGNVGNAFDSSMSLANEVDYLDTLETTTDFSVLISLVGISILLTLIASSVGMISVLKYEPLKILSER